MRVDWSKILKQKQIFNPQPKFIRDTLNVKDIVAGKKMGQWDDKPDKNGDDESQFSHLGTRPILGKAN